MKSSIIGNRFKIIVLLIVILIVGLGTTKNVEAQYPFYSSYIRESGYYPSYYLGYYLKPGDLTISGPRYLYDRTPYDSPLAGCSDISFSICWYSTEGQHNTIKKDFKIEVFWSQDHAQEGQEKSITNWTKVASINFLCDESHPLYSRNSQDYMISAGRKTDHGTYKIVVDVDNVIPETNEDNNTVYVPIICIE